MSYLMSIDIGTTNWKVIAFNPDGTIAARARVPAKTRYDNGRGYYLADDIWGSVISCIRELSGVIGLKDIIAVSATSMGESMVPVGAGGEELYPVIAWFDTRASRQSCYLQEKAGDSQIFNNTGLKPGAVFSLPRILWMRENHPEIYAKTYKWLQMADYIYFKLSGGYATDYSLASRTLAFDIRTNRWSEEMLRAAGVPENCFPTVMQSGTVLGSVSREAAQLTGLKEGTPVVVGGHDHPCATISVGALSEDILLDSSGTAESFLYVSQPDMPLPSGMAGQRQGRHLDPRRYVLWGGITASGKSVEWAVDRLTLCRDWGMETEDVPFSELLKYCRDVPCGSNGIFFLPYLRGSGAPHWDTTAKGSFLGLSAESTSPEMVKAVLEGLSYQARQIIELHETLCKRNINRVSVAGGGSRLELWQQIKADITGKTILTQQVDEASALGAAVLAGVGVGVFENMEAGSKAVTRIGKEFKPHQDRRDFYNKGFEIYKACYHSLAEINAGISGLYDAVR